MKYPATVIKGASGSGKSTSIRTLDPKETAIINIENQPLPFAKKFPFTTAVTPKEKHLFVSKFHSIFDKIIANKDIKVIVIDSLTAFSDRTQIEADITYSDFEVWAYYNNCIRDLLFKINEVEDKIIFVTAHDDIIENANGIEQNTIKIGAKVWRGKVETQFNCVLLAHVSEDEEGVHHHFVTNRIKSFTKHAIKSPIDLLPEKIDNDLNFVVQKYYEFYGKNESETTPKESKSKSKSK